jgi:DNA-binding MarR family transcriptional regulator
MSVEGRRWADIIQARTDIPMRAKVIARVLGDRHNPRTGQCTPGQERIAKDAGTSIETVRKALKDLGEAGTIERRARSKRDGRRCLTDAQEAMRHNGLPEPCYG